MELSTYHVLVGPSESIFKSAYWTIRHDQYQGCHLSSETLFTTAHLFFWEKREIDCKRNLFFPTWYSTRTNFRHQQFQLIQWSCIDFVETKQKWHVCSVSIIPFLRDQGNIIEAKQHLSACRLHRGVRGFLHGTSSCGRRCLGPYPCLREPISVREAHLRRVHLSLERLRCQSRRALPQPQRAQVRDHPNSKPHVLLFIPCWPVGQWESNLWVCASVCLSLVLLAALCRRLPEDTQPGLVRAEVGSKKLIALGLQISPVEKIIRDAVESLKSRGYISWDGWLLWCLPGPSLVKYKPVIRVSLDNVKS